MAIYDYSSGGFPASPVTDDTLAMKGTTYKYNGSAWEVQTGGTTSFTYTATSGQTAFTGADTGSKTLAYTAASIHVFLNGILLDAADYTATDGTTVTLAVGATTGDTLQVVAYGVLVSAGGGGGGAWEVILSQTVTTAVASLDFTGLSGYSSYRLIMTNLKALSHGSYFRVNLRQGGATQTGAWAAGREYFSDTGTARLFSGANQMRTSQLSYSGDANPSSAMFSIDQADEVCLKVARVESMASYGNLAQHESTIGRFNDGSLANYQRVVDGFNISSDWSGNQIIQGTFTLYGIKTS